MVNDSSTRFFFAEKEEQLDRILEVRSRCPELSKIFLFDMEGLHKYRDDQVMPFSELVELGAAYDREHPAVWDRLVEIAKPNDLAILVYTSGTTGPPKGAMLSHSNITFQLGYPDLITRLGEGDEQLSFLPLCHIAERILSVFSPLESGATVNFAESLETVPENIREVGPALFFAVPRIWEKFYSGVALRMREATPLGKLAYHWAIGVGMRIADHRIRGTRPAFGLRLLHRLADFLVLDNIRRSLGLHRTRRAGTGAAPIAPELIKWYMALGIDMREVYGQTENCGLATGVPRDRIKLGTVRLARPDTEIRIAHYAQDHSVPFTNYASLCRAKPIQELIQGEIEGVNKRFARVETIKDFRLIEQILTPEDEELTPTMKLKRSLVSRKYKELIDDMYADA